MNENTTDGHWVRILQIQHNITNKDMVELMTPKWVLESIEEVKTSKKFKDPPEYYIDWEWEIGFGASLRVEKRHDLHVEFHGQKWSRVKIDGTDYLCSSDDDYYAKSCCGYLKNPDLKFKRNTIKCKFFEDKRCLNRLAILKALNERVYIPGYPYSSIIHD